MLATRNQCLCLAVQSDEQPEQVAHVAIDLHAVVPGLMIGPGACGIQRTACHEACLVGSATRYAYCSWFQGVGGVAHALSVLDCAYQCKQHCFATQHACVSWSCASASSFNGMICSDAAWAADTWNLNSCNAPWLCGGARHVFKLCMTCAALHAPGGCLQVV
jgi:hypothetical protein